MQIGLEVEGGIVTGDGENYLREHLSDRWVIDSDPSVHVPNCYRQSAELKRKPFSIDKLGDVTGELENIFALMKFNAGCGIHCHVSPDISDMSNPKKLAFMKNIVKLFYNNQELIYQLSGYQRRSSSYCLPLRHSQSVGSGQDIVKQVTTAKSCISLFSSLYSCDTSRTRQILSGQNAGNLRHRNGSTTRYLALNLLPILDSQTKTVEFRLLDSLDYNADRVSLLIKLLYKMVVGAKNKNKVRIFTKQRKVRLIDQQYKPVKRYNHKRLYELLRSIDMLGDYQELKNHFRHSAQPLADTNNLTESNL